MTHKIDTIMMVVGLVFGWFLTFTWGILWLRVISVPFFVLLTASLFSFPWHKRKCLLVAALLLFLASTIAPIDVRRAHRPITHRIVPNLVGLPTHEATDKAMRGEVYLHGCLATGTEPKWVILW